MPTLYLVDGHTSVLNNSPINGVVNVASGFSETRSLRGNFPTVLPFDVPLDGVPQNFGDLVTKKYAGILSLYPGYGHILFAEQDDGTGWSFPPSTGTPICTVGARQATSLSLTGTIESTTTVLASTPSTVVVRWEAFQYLYTDTTGTTATRQYQEADPANFNVFVSFDSGATYTAATNNFILAIPLASQGANFKIRFQRNGGPTKLFLGSWALVY